MLPHNQTKTIFTFVDLRNFHIHSLLVYTVRLHEQSTTLDNQNQQSSQKRYKKLPAEFLPRAIVSINVLLNSRFHYEISVFIHSIKFLISFITSPFLILYNATNKDRIVTIIMIHCSFMFDSLLLYSAASFNSFRILSICTFVSLILLDIPSRLLDDLFLI